MGVSAIKGVAELVINVRDIASASRFYRDVLGFELHSQYPDDEPTIVFLTIADIGSPLSRCGHPQLFALIDPERHTDNPYTILDNRKSSLNHLAFEIDEADYESEQRRLEALGLEVTLRRFPHMKAKAIFFDDPEGNRLELICPDSAA